MSEADTSWDNYFKAVANRPAHATAERAMHALGDRRGTVLDLGAGSGRDALQFLSRGFRVKAIDSHPGTLAELKARAAEADLGDRLICETRKLEELEFRDETYDVINASMSLPFCPPQKFREVWDGIRRSLKPGGIFAGHFFGKNDTWHTGEMTFVWQSELEGLLIGMEILDLTEHELDRDTPTGEHRHWHYFEVVARETRLIEELIAKITTIAATDPERTAVFDHDQPRSYKEFASAIRCMTNRFQALRLSAGDRIGIHLDNSFEAYASIFAALALRCAYVPLSTSEPEPRLRLIVEGSGLDLLIGKNLGSLDFGPKLKTLDLALTPIDSSPATAAKIEVNSSGGDPVVYLMYTSGTTGTPKGIAISESNLVNFCDWAIDYFEIGPKDVFLGHINLTFDLSVFHLFLPFLAGASVRVTPPTLERLAPGRQLKQGVTIALLVPRMTGLLSDFRFLEPGAFPELRHLLFCGEQLFNHQIAQWRKCLPSLVIHNLYGPTEATVACSYHRIQPSDPAPDPIPIGKAIPGMTLAIRDGQSTGELLISGPQVTKYEYAGHGRPGSRFEFDVYASGDLFNQDAQGNLVWLSRIDQQVKIQGHRVELAEIEAKLGAHPAVGEVVCVFDSSTEKLFAFYTVIEGSKEADLEKSLREICRSSLPGYMHPRSFERVKAIPLTKNGKTDRKELLKRGLDEPGKGPLYDFVRDLAARQKVREPLTESTELVQSQILDSMNLVRLILVIQEKWGLKVDFSSLDKENFKDLGTIRKTVEIEARA